MDRLRNSGLTIVLMALFLLFLCGQILAGWNDFNNEASHHGEAAISLRGYLSNPHMWEATFENWESEFLQMAAFVILTTSFYQRGSAESRRPGVVELFDADPRRFSDRADAPWPVRRGGWILALYERSLGLAFVLLFLLSWLGHAWGGLLHYRDEVRSHAAEVVTLWTYLTSSRFWFESLQNWQSEFLAIAAMVYLSVYLRHRGSPESKPVHAAHDETGR